MNKKGFTLAELLGVITILGIIALIAVPTVTNTIKKQNEKAYNIQIEYLENSLSAYTAKHVMSDINGTVQLTLYQLANEGYTDYIIKNPKTGDNFPLDMKLYIIYKNGKYTYSVGTTTGTNVYTDDKLASIGVLELTTDVIKSSIVSTDKTSYIKTATIGGVDKKSSVVITSESSTVYKYSLTDSTTGVVITAYLNIVS